jgi:hypothetical protein
MFGRSATPQKHLEDEVTEKDTQFVSANVTFERLRDMANDFSPIKAEAPNQAQTTPSSMPSENEIVGDLLMAARMACSDLSPDAKNALRTLLLVITMLCKPGSRIDRDVKDLIDVASMACAELPPEKGSALRTLLRIASRKLTEIGGAARNDTTAIVDLPGRPLRPGHQN